MAFLVSSVSAYLQQKIPFTDLRRATGFFALLMKRDLIKNFYALS